MYRSLLLWRDIRFSALRRSQYERCLTSVIFAVYDRCIASNFFISSSFDGCHSGQQYSVLLLMRALNRGSITLALRLANIERVHAAIFLASSTMLEMWSDQLSSGVIVTPKSLTALVGDITVPSLAKYSVNSLEKGNSLSRFEVSVAWANSSNFCWCSFMFAWSDQVLAQSRSSCRRLVSWTLFMDFLRRVSSAKLETTECLMHDSRSFRYRINRMGPRTVPCGTPDNTLAGSECLPFMVTVCHRFVR